MSEKRVDASMREKIPHLGRLGNIVPEGYEYTEKLVTPGEHLNAPNAYLKWYNIRPLDVEISQAQVEESRSFLEKEVERLKLGGGAGLCVVASSGTSSASLAHNLAQYE